MFIDEWKTLMLDLVLLTLLVYHVQLNSTIDENEPVEIEAVQLNT